MARRVSSLSELDTDIQTSKIQVRVVRLWIAERNNNENHRSIEMLLVDKNVEKIQATAFGRLLYEKYKPKLIEGKCYTIQNFQVRENNQDYRVTPHRYKIEFHRNTAVQPLQLDLPLHCFTFIPFNDILSGVCGHQNLIDVIGELQSHEKIEIKENGSKRKNLCLRDENEVILKCSLWGELAEYAEKFIHNTEHTSLIVVFQLARLKNIREGNMLTNSWNASKIVFNPDVPEALHLKKSLDLVIESQSQRFIEVDSQSFGDSKQDWVHSSNKKTIQEIKASKQTGVAWTIATVKSLPTRYRWCYDACNKCGKKVRVISGEVVCPGCNRKPEFTLSKYKVQIQVYDPTGRAIFVLFEREAAQIIGKSADYLFQRQVMQDEEETFPVELDILLKKSFLFKIEISNYNIYNDKAEEDGPSYTVLQITDDERDIEAFKANSDYYQHFTSQDVAFLSSSSSQPQVSRNDALSLDSNHVTELSSVASLKRGRNDEDDADTPMSKMFAPESSATKLKHPIKIEKLDS